MHTTSSKAPVAEPRSRVGPTATRESDGEAGAVAISGLSHRFGTLEVIDRIDLSIRPAEVVGLVGPSGCGKSTLLEVVAGLREPTGGSVSVDGDSDPSRLGSCAYMPQRDLLLPWLSAVDNAAIALRNRGIGRTEAREVTAPLLDRFGLKGFERARPFELSGGMRQRVAFLRTVLAGKPVLLLDEPFGGLDAITRGEMQEWLAGALPVERRTVLLVTHDVEEALYLCDRVAILSSRPARIVAELAAPSPRARPRTDAVTSLDFTAARERALAALLGGR